MQKTKNASLQLGFKLSQRFRASINFPLAMFLMQISIPAPMSKELLCPEQNHFGLCSVLEGITCLQQI